jgi:hypothetical protein
MSNKNQNHNHINLKPIVLHHQYSLNNAFWRWQHWPGHQYITITSLVVGVILFVVASSPILFEPADQTQVPDVQATISNTDQNLTTSLADQLYRQLDGVVVDDISENNRRPVGVMIENLLSVRPHYGLSDASVIYETLAESGTTRFLVVYDGPGHDVPKIGPVRSARHYYLEWISEYDGLYAHAGGSPQALQAISGLGIEAVNGISSGSQYFWRDPEVGAPHNLFTNSDHLGRALLQKRLLDQVPVYESLLYKDDAPLASRPTDADKVQPTIQFSGRSYEVHYEYDTDRNTYRRFNGGVEQVEANTDEPLRATNVVVVKVPRESYLGEAGRIDLNLTGTGEAIVFRDGVAVEGTWKKPSRLERTRYYDEAGKEIALNRGQTWVEVVPGEREVSY